VGAELFHADGWTDIHDKAFHNFANIAKNSGILRSPYVTPPCRPQYVKEKKKLVGLCVERRNCMSRRRRRICAGICQEE
jgi:hypothetical protein